MKEKEAYTPEEISKFYGIYNKINWKKFSNLCSARNQLESVYSRIGERPEDMEMFETMIISAEKFMKDYKDLPNSIRKIFSFNTNDMERMEDIIGSCKRVFKQLDDL